MSRLPDYLNPPAIKISVQRLACFDCGSETNATCTCGVAYLPKAVERVAEYDQANPGQSTRQAAADLGISKSEVSRARQSPVPDGTPEPATVTGRDGKSYPAVKPLVAYPADAAIRQIIRLFIRLDAAKRGNTLNKLGKLHNRRLARSK